MVHPALKEYLATAQPEDINAAAISYIAQLAQVQSVAPEIARAIVWELRDQRTNLKLIASENYCSLATQAAMGNLLTDKYAEGVAGHRFYAGCDNVDTIEAYAVQKARELFGAEHAYVQPHSGADANLIAFWAILSAKVQAPFLKGLGEDIQANKLSAEQWQELKQKLGNQRLLALDYYSGGHLTHGYRFNVSSRMFDVDTYVVDRETGLIDYEAIEKQAIAFKPLILLAGYSAYPRLIDCERMRTIADKVGAVFMVDMAHFAGLVAGGVLVGKYNPLPYAHIVTTTTHKTLRGPRGGMILCTKEFAEYVDSGCPLVMGGPLPHVMAAKAVALTEALRPEFKAYARQIVANAQALATYLVDRGLNVVTGGTDNHLLLIDVSPLGLTGRQAESALRECGLTVNRNALPFDPNGPWYTSGIRLGTPALTTLGMKESEMEAIADLIYQVLSHVTPAVGKDGSMSKAKYVLSEAVANQVKGNASQLLSRFVLYPELHLELLERYFG